MHMLRIVHSLKIHPEYFGPVSSGVKKQEFRSTTDRIFRVGDILHLLEWNPSFSDYTGRSVMKLVTHVLDVSSFVSAPYAVLSLGSLVDSDILLVGLPDHMRGTSLFADEVALHDAAEQLSILDKDLVGDLTVFCSVLPIVFNHLKNNK